MRVLAGLVMVLWTTSGVRADGDEAPIAASPDDIGKTVVRELGSLTAAAGVAHTVAVLPAVKPAELSKRVAAVKAALGTHGLTIASEHVEDETTILVVQAKTGGRARIHLSASGGEIWIVPKPSVGTKVPGACVAIPKVSHAVRVRSSAVDQKGELRQGDTSWNFQTRRLADVDGDGVLDAFVPIAKSANDCPEQVSHRIYVMRGACGHAVGVVGPGSFGNLNVTPVDASGYKPITTSARTTDRKARGIPEAITATRTFAMKSGAYAETSNARSGGKCHHCATWWCSAVKP